jgi:hypothetical protein
MKPSCVSYLTVKGSLLYAQCSSNGFFPVCQIRLWKEMHWHHQWCSFYHSYSYGEVRLWASKQMVQQSVLVVCIFSTFIQKHSRDNICQEQGCQFCFGRCFVFSIGMECFSFGVFRRAVSKLYCSYTYIYIYIYIYIVNKNNSNSR